MSRLPAQDPVIFAPMTDLLFAGGDNHAGQHHIRCVPVVGVETAPTPATTGPITAGALTFFEGWSWINLYGTFQTKSYSEDESLTDNGPLWAVSASLFLPGDSAEQRATLQTMSPHRFIVECQDNHGIWRRLGTRTEPLSFSYKFGIAANLGGQRGATLSFAGNLTRVPPLINP